MHSYLVYALSEVAVISGPPTPSVTGSINKTPVYTWYTPNSFKLNRPVSIVYVSMSAFEYNFMLNIKILCMFHIKLLSCHVMWSRDINVKIKILESFSNLGDLINCSGSYLFLKIASTKSKTVLEIELTRIQEVEIILPSI